MTNRLGRHIVVIGKELSSGSDVACERRDTGMKAYPGPTGGQWDSPLGPRGDRPPQEPPPKEERAVPGTLSQAGRPPDEFLPKVVSRHVTRLPGIRPSPRRKGPSSAGGSTMSAVQ